jgi:hypothetical protein
VSKREEFWWILWGVGFAFLVQVLYDIAGEYPNLSQKSWYGLLIAAIFLIGLALSIRYAKKKE